ncbi:Insulin-like growth factor-binding protein 1 [Merluccius polli]|uniref:Insulin-like growth factor-binding protein 1 n=1 Tax=Merluccius polli TaxID=89951 RepID=A0AA47P1J3_MERPO|nr:Insulin-like growth factor-binding protein 1 [Merluccius polli]
MSGLYVRRHVAVAALCCVLAAAVSLGSPVPAGPAGGPEPIRCAPCTPERLSQCPAVAHGCEETLREPGCGCCLACALRAGEPCGFYTAPCGSGLKCTPRPGDARPLHSLTRGQAACAPRSGARPAAQSPEPQGTPDQAETEAEMESPAASSDPGSTHYLSGHNKPYDPHGAADEQESMNAKPKKMIEQGPCHIELLRALEKIAKSQQRLGDKFTRFYLPNCDKNGLYKAKQCDSSLDGQRSRCWCVSSWNGKRILGSADVPEDEECP